MLKVDISAGFLPIILNAFATCHPVADYHSVYTLTPRYLEGRHPGWGLCAQEKSQPFLEKKTKMADFFLENKREICTFAT